MTVEERYQEYVRNYLKEYYIENKDRMLNKAKKRYAEFTEEQKEARRKYRRQYWLKNKK